LPAPRDAQAIAGVIGRLEQIEVEFPRRDGVRYFNELYLETTREVANELDAKGFEDPRFLARLDVEFAGLYFEAIEAADHAGQVPRAWDPLFDARRRRKIASIQFAIAGMNAHINYDLCLALVETCRRLRISPKRNTAQFRDYLHVNEILKRTEARIKRRFATGLTGVADEALGRLDDVVAIWSVARARDAAWVHAESLWAIRGARNVIAAYLLTLGRMVGFAGRGLLVPTL
jgi:hypothetical protein